MSEHKDVVTVFSDIEICYESQNPDNQNGSGPSANNESSESQAQMPSGSSCPSEPVDVHHRNEVQPDHDDLQVVTSGDSPNGQEGNLKLLELFSNKLSEEQIASIYKLSDP